MSRRRYILIAAAVIATGLAAWTKSAPLLDKCCRLRRDRFSTSRWPIISQPTPEQLERARSAMEQIHGDSGLLGRRL